MSQKYALMFEGNKWLLFTFLQILIIAFWAHSCLLQRFPSLFKTKLKQFALLTSYFWINEENILYVHTIQTFSVFLQFSSYIITFSFDEGKLFRYV